MEIYDLHCDLLEYLAELEGATAFDEAARASIPQLRAGGVAFQTLAMYTDTQLEPVQSFERQAVLFEGLEQSYPNDFLCIKTFSDLAKAEQSKKIAVLAAIENASGFANEEESLDLCFKRLGNLISRLSPLLYISFTHFGENRFSGGNATQAVGLKADGEELLSFLSGKNIALDLSHTSDKAAHDMLNYIDGNGLKFQIIASHSNFRTVCDQERNLPDELAKEVIKRGGVIGLNFVCDFIGPESTDSFTRQIEYALELGAKDTLCLGADFFCTDNIPDHFKMPADYKFFHEGFDSSACYPRFVRKIDDQLGLDDEIKSKILRKNAETFLKRVLSA